MMLMLAGAAGALSACAVRTAPPSAATAQTPVAGPTESGLLPLRYDAATGKAFVTIPRLNEELLYLNTLATGLGARAVGLDRGEVGTSALVRFERHGARVYLVSANTDYTAVTQSEALRRSAEQSFPRSVLASFAVQSSGPGGVVVDATDFLLSDAFDVIGRVRAARWGTVRLDRERSFIDAANTRSYALNTEVRAVLSFTSEDPNVELRRVAPDARVMTLEQHHSFVRLPEPPLAIRPFDPRAGLFSNAYFDFAQGPESDYRQRGVVRWRLEPSDTAAYLRGEKVEPLKPITYYLDPAIPEPYRSAFIDGGRWWNDVLEAAGWRNAFRVEPLPAGADALDARYPAIYWVHRHTRGPSVGPSLRDPRTGEIITTIVRMDSYRSLVDHDIYMGLVPAAPDRLQLTAEQFSMARRRQHMAHEIGHTLGIAHNFVAATQGRSSVMDYPYPLITLNASGGLDVSSAYRPSGGANDTLAIRYAYTWFPTRAAEAAGLRQIVREAEARGLRFISDAHVGPAGSYPAATQWVEGSNMLEALQRTMAVRRVLIERFDERAAQQGEPLAVLNRRFAHVYLHHRYALQGATKYVGGMEFGYAIRGEATEATRILPAAEQRQALRLVLANLQPAALRIPERVVRLIPPVPSGYDSDLTLIPTPAGTAFDPLAAAHSLAQEIVDGLIHPERAARLVSFNARDRTSPSFDEVVGALVEATWGAAAGGDAHDAALRRVTQRATVDALLDLAGNEAATSEVRATAAHHLARLRDIASRAGAGGAEQGHRAAVRRDIDRYFDGRDDRSTRPRPAPIPLPWP
ncbi:zinc-dependent metalloprotease [soil metagenome]